MTHGILEETVREYRHQGVDVRAHKNDPAAILEASGLNWRTVPMPLYAQGRTKAMPVPNHVGLYRSDGGSMSNGGFLSVATRDYKPHHNEQLVRTMTLFATESGLNIARVGMVAGGARIWAVAHAQSTEQPVAGDTHRLAVVIRSGHEPGIATQIKGLCERLVCLNGAVVAVGGGRARFIHSAELTAERIGKARQFVLEATAAYRKQLEVFRLLMGVPSSRGIALLYMTQLFSPDLYRELMQQYFSRCIPGGMEATVGEISGQTAPAPRVIELASSGQGENRIWSAIESSSSRTLKRAISAMDKQPGGRMTSGRLAHPYQGVTFYNSHIRGAGETGLESNFDGASANDSLRALALATAYAPVVSTVMGTAAVN